MAASRQVDDQDVDTLARQITMAPVEDPRIDADLVAHARHLLELLARISGLASTYITNIDWDDEFQHVVVSHNVEGATAMPEGMRVPWEYTMCRRAMEEKFTSTNDLQARFPDCLAAELMDVRTFVSVPVLDAEGSVYGTLCGISPERVGVSVEVEETMTALAELVTLQLRERAATREITRQADALAAANERLQTLALTDELTGLPNRRGVLEGLDRLAAAARRRSGHLSVVWIDVDHFKAINDRHGHQAGDEALRTIARSMSEALRGEDLAGRMGGDEFVILLPDTDAAGAAVVAERVRTAVAAQAGEFAISISAGVAVGDGTAPEATLVAADDALYTAKEAGRGRVAVT